MDVRAERLVEAAYEAHRAPLVRHLAQVMRDGDAAEDLAQEAFLRLTREAEAGRAPDDVPAWLHRVGLNLAMSRGRHLAVVDRSADRLPRPAEPASPEDVIVGGELTRAVALVMATMSGDEQQVLLLAAHGYASAEIATSIGRTTGATRALLCRARSRIRQRVSQYDLAPA